MLLFAKEMLLMNETFRDVDMSTVTAIVIVVSPLNALINNQISRLGLSGIRASVLGVKCHRMKNSIPLTVTFDFATRKNCAQVIIILYLHIRCPLSLVNMDENCHRVRRTKRKISAIVIDEAHCILEWYVFVLFCFGYKYRTNWNRHAYIYTL